MRRVDGERLASRLDPASQQSSRSGLVRREYGAHMSGLGEVLSLTALMAATLEYAILMRHREERRDAVRWQEEFRESLLSLGRISSSPERRWTDEGSRFRLMP